MYIFVAVAAGAGIAFQAVINARLRVVVQSPVWAALIQTFVGLALLATIALIAREGPLNVSGASRAPWWVWTGGLLGATYVVASIVATAPLGAAVMFAAVIVGQVITSLLIDHYGLMGVAVQPLTPVRAAGAGLLLAGLVLIRLR